MEQKTLQDLASQTLPMNADNREGDVIAENETETQVGVEDLESGADEPTESNQTNILTQKETTLPKAVFTKVEKSLASLGFFTPSSRRIKDQKVKRVGFTREVEGKRVEVSAEIHPSGVFGLPITADQDKYLALQRIITNTLQSEGKLTNPIRFKSAELLRLLDNSRKSGKNYKEVSEWLDVMSATTIISDGAVYDAGRKRFARDRFRVFDRAVSVGKELDDGTVADANYVWLSAWQLENINNNFLLPIDFETYRELKNHIAKALVPLLQIWLYATQKVGAFEKRYDELCGILTLQTYRPPSLILRQFKPSLDELTQHGYLEKWRIEKTSDRKAFKIIFFHGPKFHRDRRKRIEQKSQSEPPVVIAESEPVEPSLPEPGKTQGAPAVQDRVGTGQRELRRVEGKLVDELAARGLMPSTVMKLLESLPPEQLDRVPDLIEYWDAQRRVADVRPGLLYDLIRKGEPLPVGFETRRRRAERLASEERGKKLERAYETVERRYEAYCRQSVDRYIAEALPAGEYERRVSARREETLQVPGYWAEHPEFAEQLARRQVQAEIAKVVPLPTLEEFRQQELPRILSELNLDPGDFGLQLEQLPGTGQPGTTQDAVNGPPPADPLKEGVFATPEQNSSPAPL